MASDHRLSCPQCGETESLGLNETYRAMHPVRAELREGVLTLVLRTRSPPPARRNGSTMVQKTIRCTAGGAPMTGICQLAAISTGHEGRQYGPFT